MAHKRRDLNSEGLDKGTVYFEYTSGPDQYGNYGFSMIWWAEGFHMGPSWRGQCFCADPLPFIQKQRVAGLKISEKRVR